MKRLIVYLNGEFVGNLDQDDSGLLVFRYAIEWLKSSDAMPLSRSLPLRSEAFVGKQARSFFAGILPEERPRRQIASIFGISESNDFAMLEHIGGECAGAVTLLPEGAPPPVAHDVRMRELDDDELQRIIAELPSRPLMAGEEGLRLSLAGVQDKLPVVLRGLRIGLPCGNTPSTHIIKPEPDGFPGLVVNEVFCMMLAKAVGLNVPGVEIRYFGDKACILVERYDRITSHHGTVKRIHQEDFCQALGFPPERKYQQEGGPLLRDCVAMLRDWSTAPVLDIRDFLDGLIFNVLIGNADAHGKNYSLIYFENERRLAPFYDLVCTLAWPEISKIPAMKIGRSDSIVNITPVHWKKMTEETGLGWPMVRDRIAELSLKTVAALQSPFMLADGKEKASLERVVSIVKARASSLHVKV